MTLTRLLLRRHRLLLGSWLLLLIALCGGTVTAYQSTYATDRQRRTAVELAQHNPATTLLYGRLPDPGTPAQLYAWEIGAFATILAAVMAVLVTVALTRAGEDDGTLEVVRGCGISARQPLRSALTILAGVAAVLAAGSAAVAGLAGRHVDGVSGPGALTFGAVVGLTFLLTAALTGVLAQIAPTGGAARLLGMVAVGAGFALRAFADTHGHPLLDWFTPLGLRATAQPFTGDHWPAPVAALLAATALAGAAAVLTGRREFRAGLLARHDSHTRRLHVRTITGLTTRLVRSPLTAWTAAVAAVGALFAAMGSGTVTQQRHGDLGGFLGAQLGTGDPAAGYLAYTNTVIGIIVAVYAVKSVTTSRYDEAAGLTDLVLCTGVRRWKPLAARAGVTAAGCAAILLTAGAVQALIAPAVLDGTDIAGRAAAYAVGQWPAALAATGCATLLAGLCPRRTGLAWLPVITSGTLALLGTLLHVPGSVQRLGFFRHVPDIAVHPQIRGLLLLTCLGIALCWLGAAGTTRRDITVG